MPPPTELDPADYTKTRCCWWWDGTYVSLPHPTPGQLPLRRAVVNYRLGKRWRRTSAAVIALKASKRKPTTGKPFVLHHCDNLLCVRPDHLYVGNTKRPRGQRNPAVHGKAPRSCHGDCINLYFEAQGQ